MGVLLVLPWMLKDYKTSFKTSNGWLIFIRALSSLLNTGLIYISVQMIPLVDATLLTNSAPIFVPFIAWIWVRTPLSHKLWIPIFIGFLGIVLILKPGKAIFNLGAFYALASGVFTGISLLAVRLTANKEKLHTALFYMFLIGWVLTIPFALWDWRIDSLNTFFFLIAIGVLVTLGQWALFKAMQYGRASHLAPFGYVSVVYAGIMDWLLYGHLPDLFTLFGIALVTVGGIALIVVTKPPKTEGKRDRG